MSDETLGAVLMWFLTLYAAALALPIIAAVAIASLVIWVVFIVMRKVFNASRDLVQGPPAVRQVRRIERDRDSAVRDLIAIRQDAVRRMQVISRDDVIEGRAWDE
jgi:hypothetical protein